MKNSTQVIFFNHIRTKTTEESGKTGDAERQNNESPNRQYVSSQSIKHFLRQKMKAEQRESNGEPLP